MLTATCRYCGCERRAGAAMVQHERACIANPVAHAATLAILTDPDNPGMAIKSHVYAKRVRGVPDAISDITLRHRFGSWSEVCAYFGFGVGRAGLDAPLTECERHACARRGRLEFAR